MYKKNHNGLIYQLVLIAIVSGSFILLPLKLQGLETGYRYLRNYTYKEYDHHPQNWGLAQATNGIIYVGNTGGILEYDGVSWRIIGIPGYEMVRSIAVDGKTGVVYVGGKNKFGHLVTNPSGTLEYTRLDDGINESIKFGNIYATHIAKEGVFFRSQNFLFQWHNGKLKTIKPKHHYIASFVCDNNLYVQQLNVGMMQLEKNSLVLIPGGEIFAKIQVSMMVPFNIGMDNHSKIHPGQNQPVSLLIGTRFKGFYLFNGKKVSPFTIETHLEDYLKKNWLIHGTRLSGGDIALATRRGGIVIINSKGQIKNIYNKQSGLQDENVKFLMEDRQGNVWAALGDGISRIEMQSPFFLYDGRMGLPGVNLSILRFSQDLYVGTPEGLYVLNPKAETFHPIAEINNPCWALVTERDSLLAATSIGVQLIKKVDKGRNEYKIQRLFKESIPVYALLPSKRYNGYIWCGTGKGLIKLSQDGDSWELHRFKNINTDTGCIVETEEGYLWLGSRYNGVSQVDFRNFNQEPIVKQFGEAHGLPSGSVFIAKAAGHIMFATQEGIYRFEKESELFVPDWTLGKDFAGKNTEDSSCGGFPVFRITEDDHQHIWFHSQSRNYLAVPSSDNSYKIESIFFRRIPIVQVQGIYPDPDGENTWFASMDGLIRYDKRVKRITPKPYSALIRTVWVNENERLIFNGAHRPLLKVKEKSPPQIPYDERNVYFEFAAPFFENEQSTEYRCFLEGNDKDWSKWSNEHKRYYTNLGADHYTFRVEARNIYLQKGTAGNFQFHVLPPWYQSWWATLLYILAAGLAILGIIKWRSHKLIQDKRNLEAIIRDRTREIKAQSDRLEKQTVQLKNQSEQLKEMDRVKSRFFANISHEFRTPLTLIMSPLEQMLSELGRDKGEKRRLNIMLRNSQRLLTLINKLLDLARFDSKEEGLMASCQDIVPYTKNVLDSFQVLARQNQLNLEFSSDKEVIELYYDAPKLEEALYNLIINAIKFTPPGGTVSVKITENKAPNQSWDFPNDSRLRNSEKKEMESSYVEISVADTGCGIPNEQLPHIFDRFYKSRGLLKAKSTKGTGLGLALTKEIIMLHQGKIDVHSREGKGTEFVIQLPLGHKHLTPEEIVLNSETVPDYSKSRELAVIYETGEEEWEHEIEHKESTIEKFKTLILVVEDEADVRKYICEPLRQEYRIIEAINGKDGIEKAKEFIPDLIISDIMMPEADGYELCRVLKNNFETSHIPIILLTAKASAESTLRGLEKGADDYITKPFNVQMLLARVRNLIDLRRQLQLKIQRKNMLLPAEIEVSSQDDEFLKEMQAIIEQNLSDPDFDIKVLQEKLLIGRTTLFRKIEALTGDTPNQFLQSYRLERGARLLRENYGNVTDVAMAVGFDSPQYFATCFKKKYHQSPSSYQATESKT